MSSKHDPENPGAAGEDATVTRVWRQGSDELPPARLDASILAAGRRSVQKNEPGAKTVPVAPRARSRWLQWQSLAAAATVAGLAFVLVQTLPREREVAAPMRMEAPTPASAPAATQERQAGPPAQESPVAAPVTADAADSVSKEAVEAAERSPAGDVMRAMREAEMDQRKAVMPEAPPEVETPESAAAPMGRALGGAAPPDPVDWPATIATLYASGDTVGAAEALRAFRAVDPDADAQLPESLQEWARTVE